MHIPSSKPNFIESGSIPLSNLYFASVSIFNILEVFLIGNDVNASFNVSYVDYTLYYELFDNGLFSFDFGLTARDFNGAVTVTGDTTGNYDEYCYGSEPVVCITTTDSVTPSGKIKTDEIVPMLYVATNISLPLRRLSVFAQGDFLLIDDHSLYDYQVGLSYGLVDNRMGNFNLTLGYRVVKIEFEDLEVAILPVPAYSTLGWSDLVGGDPVLNTFIWTDEIDLVRLLIHEMGHQQVFVKNDTLFNESFASFVEDAGSLQWIKKNGDSNDLVLYEEKKRQRDSVGKLLRSSKETLENLFNQNLKEKETALLKEKIFIYLIFVIMIKQDIKLMVIVGRV